MQRPVKRLGQSDQLVVIKPRPLAFERARMDMDLYLHLLALVPMDMELPDLGLELDPLQVLMVADQLQLLKPKQLLELNYASISSILRVIIGIPIISGKGYGR